MEQERRSKWSEREGKEPVQMRLSATAREFLRATGERYGISKTEVVEKLVRGEFGDAPMVGGEARRVPVLAEVLAAEPEVERFYRESPMFRKMMQVAWRHVQ